MLPKKQKLKLKKDFDRVFQSGKSLRNAFFVLAFVSNQRSFCRGAVVVQAKKFPKAIARNKIKRTIFTILAKIFSAAQFGVDTVIIVQPIVKDKKFSEVEKSLFEIFKKANIV